MADAADAMEDWRRVNASMLDYYERQMASQRSYTAVITSIGYAGLLALWNGVRSHLGAATVLGTAVLIGLSLLVFAANEVAKTSIDGWAHKDFLTDVVKHYDKPDFQVRMTNLHAVALRRSDFINWPQPAVFVVTNATAFGAAIWLASAALATALRVWQSC